MTRRQQLFAEHYALSHNGAAAAVRAGYARRSARQIASELLAKPDLRELVSRHEAAAAQELGLTREKVLQGLWDAYEMACRQENPVAMVAPLREMAKISGFYAPERTKVEINLNGDALQAKFAAMSDAELLAIAEGRTEQ